MSIPFTLCSLLVLFLSLLFTNLTTTISLAQGSPAPAPAPAPAPTSEPAPTPAPTPAPAPTDSSPPPPPPTPASSPPPPAPSDSEQTPPTKGSSGRLSGGQKAGISIGVIMGAIVIGLGGLVYKKRRDNMRRSRFGFAARRSFL